MEPVGDNAQPPFFPQRKASLRRWASRETLAATGAVSNSLKNRANTEASLMSLVGHLEGCIICPLTISQQQYELEKSHPKEPLMRVRTDGKLTFPAWPTLKSSSPRMNRAAATNIVARSEDPSPTTKAPSFGLRNMLPGSSWSAKKREAVQSRRKPSVSDVDLSPMTTLQEISLDSRRYS